MVLDVLNAREGVCIQLWASTARGATNSMMRACTPLPVWSTVRGAVADGAAAPENIRAVKTDSTVVVVNEGADDTAADLPEASMVAAAGWPPPSVT